MSLLVYRSSIHTFQGSPHKTITAIDVSGGIACSQTSGKTPCFVQASAHLITATGSTFPFKDLFYVWDFGDSASTETFANPGVGGGTVNSNNSQKGPIATHCYRSAGAYTITLKIWGKNGSGYTATTVTQEITVSAFTASGGEYWADSTHGGTNAGTEANPFNTIAAINTALASGSNKALHVKKGSAFTGAVGLLPWASSGASLTSGLRIDTYGTGAIPSFDVSSSDTSAILMNNGGSSSPMPKTDVVVSGIRFTNSGTNTAGITAYVLLGNDTAAITHFYWDNCEFHTGVDSAQGESMSMASTVADLSKIGQWNCVNTTIAGVTTYKRLGVYISATEWYFDVGGSYEGSSNVAGEALAHHTYPSVQRYTLHRWINFKQGDNRSYCINLDSPIGSVGDPVISNYHLIADCNGTGTGRFHDASNGQNDIALSLTRNLVCERNKLHDFRDSGVIVFYCTEDYTNRFNHIWGNPGCYFQPAQGPAGAILSSEFYGNKGYWASGATTTEPVIALNDASWTLVHKFHDNIWQDMRATARFTAFPYDQAIVADRNQYYAPNDSDSKAWYDTNTAKSFAEHQTALFDVNGSVADPGWTDAANGDFS